MSPQKTTKEPSPLGSHALAVGLGVQMPAPDPQLPMSQLHSPSVAQGIGQAHSKLPWKETSREWDLRALKVTPICPLRDQEAVEA